MLCYRFLLFFGDGEQVRGKGERAKTLVKQETNREIKFENRKNRYFIYRSYMNVCDTY